MLKNLSKMSLREQWLILIVVLVIIGGLYGGLRFYPAYKAIGDIKKNTETMRTAMTTMVIPEEPYEDADTLEADLYNVDNNLSQVNALKNEIDKRLSPPDTTILRLAISDAARNALVRIITNEEYRVTLPVSVAEVDKDNAAPKAKRTGDAQKKRERNQRRAAEKATTNLVISQVSPELATPLIRKLAINGPMERPMQRIVVEGTYAGIVQFIQNLDVIEKMVTVVQLQIALVPQETTQGLSQRLSATMVLAL